ncbi:MAG: SDR family oxidoreductase [bacterium]
MSETVVITGANRGIGLEFARQYAREGWTVIGTARNPEEADELKNLDGSVTVLPLDVTDEDSIESCRKAVNDQHGSIDRLINNAGVMGSKEAFENLASDELREVFDVNCLGAFRLTQAFRSMLEDNSGSVVFVTSLMGSIEDNQSGGSYAYRISKAGLNMLAKTLSEDFAPETLTVLLLHPGWVQTRMGGPSAKISVEESVGGMREVIASASEEDHGKFLSYEGEELPW